MKQRSNLTQSEGGQILIFVIIILMLAVLVIPAILGLTYSSAHTIDIRTEKTQALYAADSGIEDALYKLSNLGNDTLQVTDYSSSNCGGNLVEIDDWVEYTLGVGAPALVSVNGCQVDTRIEYKGNATLPTYLITSTASSSANPTVTVQARVYIGNNTGNTIQPGPPVVGTSPFDYAMACLSPTGPDFGGKAITITGDLYSNGPIDFPGASKVQSDGTHAGSVWASGTVTLENSGVNIAGDVHSTGDITLGQTANIGGSAYAAGSIQATGTESKIWGSAQANGAINVQNASGIAHTLLANGDIHVSGPVSSWGYNGGNISSNGNVIVDNNGKIIGHVSAGGTVTHSNGIINGTIIEHAPQSPVSLPAIPSLVANDVAFWQEYWGDMAKAGGTTGSQTVDGGNLGPIYIAGDLTISNQATVQLTGTVYVTGNVEVGAKAEIKGPGEIVAEGIIHDNPNCTYGDPGQLVLLMSLSTLPGAIDLQGSDVQGAMNCVFYAPYGGVSVKNHTTMFGAMIGQTLYSHNGNSITWTEDVYSIPGLPGGYVSQGNETWTPVQQVTFTGPVIDYYKVCDSQSCSP